MRLTADITPLSSRGRTAGQADKIGEADSVARWVESIMRARYLAASLGESATTPWWRTEALTPVGQRLLVRLFPRTPLCARLETAGRAAAIEHDNHIGRVGAYHLFRLPIADETVVRDHLHTPGADALLGDLAVLSDAAARLDALRVGRGRDNRRSARTPALWDRERCAPR